MRLAPRTDPITVGARSRPRAIARVGKVIDPSGRETIYELDYDRVARQYITTIRYPATPAVPAVPTAGGRPELPELPALPGRIVHGLYDSEGRLLQQALGASAQRVTHTLIRRTPFDEETVDERGLKTRTLYDAARNPLRVTYPDGSSITTDYEANFSLPVRRVDERGVVTLYQYDARGNLLKQV